MKMFFQSGLISAFSYTSYTSALRAEIFRKFKQKISQNSF